MKRLICNPLAWLMRVRDLSKYSTAVSSAGGRGNGSDLQRLLCPLALEDAHPSSLPWPVSQHNSSHQIWTFYKAVNAELLSLFIT